MQSKTFNGLVGFHVFLPINYYATDNSVINIGWVRSIDYAEEIYGNLLHHIENKKKLKVYIRHFTKKNFFVPNNNLLKNEWFYPEKIDFQLKYFNIDHNFNSEKNYYFVLAEPAINKYFVDPRTLLNNRHFEYMITWYLLGISSIVMLIILRRKN